MRWYSKFYFETRKGNRMGPLFHLRILFLSVSLWTREDREIAAERGLPFYRTGRVQPRGRYFYIGPVEIILGP